MSSCFIISADEDRYGRNRLLSYSGTVKGGKMILTLKVEVGSSMSFELETLESILRAEAQRSRAAKKPRLLALPAPKPGEA